MIILHDKYGQQLGNRLILFSHFIAFSERTNTTILYPAFEEYAHLFYGTRYNPLCRYPSHIEVATHKIFRKIYHDAVQIAYVRGWISNLVVRNWIQDITLPTLERRLYVHSTCAEDIDLLQRLASHKIVFFAGWRFRDFEGVVFHAEKIRHFFKPAKNYMNDLERFTRQFREGCDTLIGLHIRLGDYKEQAAQWYFTLDYYRQLVIHLQSIFSNRNCFILLASNENVREHFTDISNIKFCPGHILLDLYLLAECDYIIGAPSTYSEWAAFYGNKRYFRILEEGIFPTPNDFMFIDAVGRDF